MVLSIWSHPQKNPTPNHQPQFFSQYSKVSNIRPGRSRLLEFKKKDSVYWLLIDIFSKIQTRTFTKAELLQEGIHFLIHLFARDVLVLKICNLKKLSQLLFYQF